MSTCIQNKQRLNLGLILSTHNLTIPNASYALFVFRETHHKVRNTRCKLFVFHANFMFY